MGTEVALVRLLTEAGISAAAARFLTTRADGVLSHVGGSDFLASALLRWRGQAIHLGHELGRRSVHAALRQASWDHSFYGQELAELYFPDHFYGSFEPPPEDPNPDG